MPAISHGFVGIAGMARSYKYSASASIAASQKLTRCQSKTAQSHRVGPLLQVRIAA